MNNSRQRQKNFEADLTVIQDEHKTIKVPTKFCCQEMWRAIEDGYIKFFEPDKNGNQQEYPFTELFKIDHEDNTSCSRITGLTYCLWCGFQYNAGNYGYHTLMGHNKFNTI
jgi:hypothetical protein